MTGGDKQQRGSHSQSNVVTLEIETTNSEPHVHILFIDDVMRRQDQIQDEQLFKFIDNEFGLYSRSR